MTVLAWITLIVGIPAFIGICAYLIYLFITEEW